MTQPTMPNEYPELSDRVVFDGASPSEIVLSELRATAVDLDFSSDARRDHGRDWWPLTIGWVSKGSAPALPAVVARPKTTQDVSRLLAVAHEYSLPVTPQGGRSGVVGGAVPATGGVALDLTAMDAIISIDEVSLTVTVEAGCFGPDLENALNARGFTVGHFPQSFALATVGGWLACRGAGQYSNRYGKIEDMVRGLTVVLADGSVITTGARGPRSASGPDLNQLFVGSEGTLGVITQATLVIHHKPDYEARAAYSFASCEEGLEACRRIMQRGARPAVLRLYDEVESERSFTITRCALIVIDEGDPGLVDATMKIVEEECAVGQREDDAHVATWFEHRNNVSALAPLWSRDYVVDTIEIAAPWAALSSIHRRVVEALTTLPETMVASMHQSHAYQDGACLYFTFVAKPEGDLTAYYRAAWDAATAVVLAAGGALSHHHGVGRNRARFVREALGSSFDVLVDIKDTLDPHHIMNPGVLGIGGTSW